jgi:ribosome-binding protein aMBF1 (putative translation factor)
MYEQPYHGPHAVFSREELQAIKTDLADKSVSVEDLSRHLEVVDSVLKKINAALESHPDFLKPAQ